MELKIRNIDEKYRYVKIIVDGIEHDLGFLDKRECLELAVSLEGALDDLMDGWKE